jgi:hypothetical protein
VDTCGALVNQQLAQLRQSFAGCVNCDTSQLAATVDNSNDAHCQCDFHVDNVPTTSTDRNAPLCGYEDDLSNPTYAADTCPTTDPNKCPASATPSYSQPSLTLTAAQGADPLADVSQPFSCLTCNDKGADDVQGRYTCLTSNLVATFPTGVDAKALQLEIHHRLARLIEERGSSLTAAEQTLILGYDLLDAIKANPAPACSSDTTGFDLPTVPASCTTPPELNRLLTFCRQIASLPGATNPTLTMVDACAQLPSHLATLAPTDGCQGVYRRAVAKVIGLLVQNILSGQVHTDDDVALLGHALAFVQRWYAAERALFAGATDLSPALLDTEQVVRAFWDATHGNGIASVIDPAAAVGPDAGAPPIDSQAVLDAAARDLETDRRILLAAFTPDAISNKTPLHGAPLLYLLTPSLRTVLDRASATFVYHDVACRFLLAPDGSGKSCAEAKTPTQETDLIGVLAQLLRGTSLSTAVVGATNLKGASLVWWNAFSALAAQHGTLDDALADALPDATLAQALKAAGYADGRNGQLLDVVPAASWSPPIVELAQVATDARGKADAFAKTGYFDGRTSEHLAMGIQESRHDAIVSALTTELGTLGGAINTYKADRDKAANALLAEVRQQGTLATLDAQANMKLQSFIELSHDLEGLRARDRIEDAKFGEFAQAFADAVKRPDTDLNRPVNQTQYTLTPSAANARYTNRAPITNFAISVSASTPALSAKKGDLITIDATGQWAPNCAFSKVTGTLNPPLDHVQATGGANGLTGPEGYILRLDGSSYTNNAVSETNANDTSETSSQSLKVCAGVEVHSGGDFFGNGAKVYASVEGCLTTDSSTRTSQTDSSTSGQGSEARATLAVSQGARLPNTPFPSLPAGSLVAVEMQRGTIDLSNVRRLHVVTTGRTAILLDGDSDVYFVVNDVGGCTADPSALSVTVTHSQPTNTNALMAAMGDALATMRSSAQQFLDQGRILSSDMTALRSSALVTLGNQVGALDQYSSSFRDLYTAWADLEVNHIDRLVEIQQLDRQRTQVADELRMLRAEYDNAQDQSPILHAMSYWSFRDLDVSTLSAPIQFVGTDLETYLYPVIRLRYPTVLTQINGDKATHDGLIALLNADWRVDPSVTAQRLKDAGDNIASFFRTASLGTPDLVNGQTVVLSFPTPNTSVPYVPSQFHKASSARAAQVWNALSTSQRMSFEVLPEDLIFPGTVFSELSCTGEVPIITSMAVMFAGSSFPAADTLNGFGQTATLTMSPGLEIPTRRGLEYYTIDDPSWLPNTIPVGYAQTDKVLANFNARTSAMKVGNGLSPFTSYSFDFTSKDPSQPAWQLPPNTTEIMLVFTVQWTNLPAPGMSWLPACSGTP